MIERVVGSVIVFVHLLLRARLEATARSPRGPEVHE